MFLFISRMFWEWLILSVIAAIAYKDIRKIGDDKHDKVEFCFLSYWFGKVQECSLLDHQNWLTGGGGQNQSDSKQHNCGKCFRLTNSD